MASGHVANFCDPLIDCKACRGRYRADHLLNKYFSDNLQLQSLPTDFAELTALIKTKKIKCPNCKKHD